MKEKKKYVTYRIRESTIENVRREAEAAGVSINDYADKRLSKVSKKKKVTP
jgi:predicted HicB family RNase H-like nuclease